jgi:hypothetical protein
MRLGFLRHRARSPALAALGLVAAAMFGLLSS